jgi:hypothetical protein
VRRRDLAAEFARSELAHGRSVQSATLFQRAAVLGISAKTLRRALKEIGARPVKGNGDHAPWSWSLPDPLLELVEAVRGRAVDVVDEPACECWFPRLARCRGCDGGVTFHESYLCPRCLHNQRGVS